MKRKTLQIFHTLNVKIKSKFQLIETVDGFLKILIGFLLTVKASFLQELYKLPTGFFRTFTGRRNSERNESPVEEVVAIEIKFKTRTL